MSLSHHSRTETRLSLLHRCSTVWHAPKLQPRYARPLPIPLRPPPPPPSQYQGCCRLAGDFRVCHRRLCACHTLRKKWLGVVRGYIRHLCIDLVELGCNPRVILGEEVIVVIARNVYRTSCRRILLAFRASALSTLRSSAAALARSFCCPIGICSFFELCLALLLLFVSQ